MPLKGLSVTGDKLAGDCLPVRPAEFQDKFPIKWKLKVLRMDDLEDLVSDISRQKENKLSISPKMINKEKSFRTFSRGFSGFHIYDGSLLTDLTDATRI